MTEREMLELAAKAAGIELQWESDGTIQNRMNRPTIPYHCQNMSSAIDWNPRDDDGDALRLAVKLKLFVSVTDTDTTVGWDVDAESLACETLFELHGNDPGAATRLAITRAAAEIGRNMT